MCKSNVLEYSTYNLRFVHVPPVFITIANWHVLINSPRSKGILIFNFVRGSRVFAIFDGGGHSEF